MTENLKNYINLLESINIHYDLIHGSLLRTSKLVLEAKEDCQKTVILLKKQQAKNIQESGPTGAGTG
jgi:hypothetical protein